jgi:hypothetical protein
MEKFIIIMCAVAAVASGCSKGRSEALETPAKKALVLPITNNDTGKTLIQTVSASEGYPYNSFVITSSGGESIILDPTEMPARSVVEFNPVIIASTHGHMDHVDMDFTASYDCKKISYFETDVSTRDFRVYTILSSHTGQSLGTSNVIIVVEVDGLRIAHFGDIGQNFLTEEQLAKLGKIDIAFMQFITPYSSMTLDNEKAFKLMDQARPAVIVPTHHSEAAFPAFERHYGKIAERENFIAVSRSDIPTARLNLWRILNNHRYE